jgi:hypothetical protein
MLAPLGPRGSATLPLRKARCKASPTEFAAMLANP